MMEPPEPKYLNVTETARRLGVHPNTVRNWVKQGLLKSQRVPGSKFNRFLAADVDRLANQRGGPASTLQEERSNVRVSVVGSSEYVDATDLEAWARRTESNTRFPELMRRLLAATPNTTAIQVRAGDGVSLGGWDGRAMSAGSAFLPEGRLGFEFGTGAKPKGKADEDYEKRSQDEDAKELVFVFATPRRWSGGAAWATKRLKEHRFAGVLVLDADTIEGWLQASPSVHTWLSEMLGRSPSQAQTLRLWWSLFSKTTEPPLVPELFLAGRTEQRDQLLGRLRQAPQATLIQADSIADCLAFASATLESATASDSTFPVAVVVSGPDVWKRVVEQPERSILIPRFDEPDVAAALRNNHHVLLVADRATAARTAGIELPRLDRSRVAELLQNSGLDFLTAQRLAALARRSLPAMIRKLSHDPRVTNPSWTQPPAVSILGPLLLAGQWLATPGDLQIVEQLTKSEWNDIERTLRQLERSSDPPLRPVGDRWAFASPEEAFILLRDSFTRQDAATWLEIMPTVLLEPDPVLDLPAEERVMAGVRGIHRAYSPVVRDGLAQAAALMGELGSSTVRGARTSLADIASSAVSRVLKAAHEDETGRTWRELADVLPLLAEAAPEAFLDTVGDDLATQTPTVRHMFETDLDSPRSFGTFSPHTHLLWALERLCWSDDYLVPSVRVLALLAALDPAPTSQHGNRPRASLAAVLCSWVRNTGASLATRREAIDVVCRTSPDVGWNLVIDLIPDRRGFVLPPAAPHVRDWRPTRSGVPMPELVEYLHHVVGLAVGLAAGHADRLSALAEQLTNLPPADREAVFEVLEHQSPSELSNEDRFRLWEQLDRLVARYQSFSTAVWALPTDQLDRLDQITRRITPVDDPQRFSYLFGRHPDLPDVDAFDFDARETRLRELRHEALQTILALPDPLAGLEQLARHVQTPLQLGLALAEDASVSIHQLAHWFNPDDQPLYQVATAWAQRKSHGAGGPEWLADALQAPELSEAGRRIVISSAPAVQTSWDALAATGRPEDVAYYWNNAPMHATNLEDIPEAASQLVEHQRAWAAIELVGRGVELGRRTNDNDSPALDAEVVKLVLSSAIQQQPSDQEVSSMTGYTVGVLLDYLEHLGTPSQDIIPYEFAFYRLIEHQREARALNRALASDPRLFVELNTRVYRAKSEPQRELDEQASALVNLTWWVLNGWHGYPGQRADGSLDGAAMLEWVQAARLEFSESDRADIGDEIIGQTFAGSPKGVDGIWPAEPVRDMVETIGSRELENGLVLGKVNSRGVTSRGVYDGGAQERTLAADFRAGSNTTKSRWPRTSRLLRELAESYERDAKREDIRAEQYADEA